MLLLFRKKGEEIYINKGQIKIQVIEQKGDNILLGVRAPAHVDINRKELYFKKLISEKKANSSVSKNSKDEK